MYNIKELEKQNIEDRSEIAKLEFKIAAREAIMANIEPTPVNSLQWLTDLRNGKEFEFGSKVQVGEHLFTVVGYRPENRCPGCVGRQGRANCTCDERTQVDNQLTLMLMDNMPKKAMDTKGATRWQDTELFYWLGNVFWGTLPKQVQDALVPIDEGNGLSYIMISIPSETELFGSAIHGEPDGSKHIPYFDCSEKREAKGWYWTRTVLSGDASSFAAVSHHGTAGHLDASITKGRVPVCIVVC